MILSKIQIIHAQLKDYDFKDKFVKKVVRIQLNMPEHIFIEMAKKELNFNLEIIRKNLYIIH